MIRELVSLPLISNNITKVAKIRRIYKDFKYICVPQYDEYYEISVSVDEDDKTVTRRRVLLKLRLEAQRASLRI